MPRYVYECPTCGKTEEVSHGICEIDNPTEKTQIDTSCNEHTCTITIREMTESEDMRPIIPEYGTKWVRIPQAPSLTGFVGGVSVGEKGVLSKKQSERKKRSLKHFKKEVMPTQEMTPNERRHFEKKTKYV